MTSKVLLSLIALLVVGLIGLPADAKGPWRVTVEGPGIKGEVDLFEHGRSNEGFALWSANELLAMPLPQEPTQDLGTPYVVTWYAVMGAVRYEDQPTPMVDRVAYYPESGVAQILKRSGGYWSGQTGWYRVRRLAATFITDAAGRIQEYGLTGVAGYEFVTEGFGPNARAYWIGKPFLRRGFEGWIGPV